MPRLLVVDENLDKRISTELNRRGRTAKTVAELGLKGWNDPRLFERLHEIDADCVLITGDDAMPAPHAAELRRLETTVAVIAPWEAKSALVEPQWEHEIAQKWAHKMELQLAGSVVRYSLAAARKWTLRKRAPRLPT